MGADGGSIVKPKNQAVKAAVVEKEVVEDQWRPVCGISGEQLREPVCGDALGVLYNREAVLEMVLRGETHGSVGSTKDIVPVAVKLVDGYVECPVTGLRMGPSGDVPVGKQLVYLTKCGCLCALSAVQAVHGMDGCPVCGKDRGDDVVVHASGADKTRLEERLRELRQKGYSFSGKKSKKVLKPRKP